MRPRPDHNDEVRAPSKHRPGTQRRRIIFPMEFPAQPLWKEFTS
jgi:hypothetical protein